MRGSYGDVVIKEIEPSEPAPSPEVVHSWAPNNKKGSEQKKAPADSLRDLLKSYASWVIVLTVAIDALALAFEPLELLRHGAPVLAAIASTLAAFGLAVFFASAAAIPIACVYSAVRYVGRLRRPWSHAWPVPLLLLGWLIIESFAPRPAALALTRMEARLALFCLLAVLLVVATIVARFEKTAYRSAFGALLGFLMVALSYLLPPTIHHEPRDIVWFCLVVSALAVVYPLRRILREADQARVMSHLGTLVAVSVPMLFVAPHLSPTYRGYAHDYGAFTDRLGRFGREIVDLDGDGFSAVFGGFDCDDFDESRNPGVLEAKDGKDRNCNGVVRPANPAPADLGIAPPSGEPDASPGSIDRMVIVTFDCFRNDAFRPDVTPNLVRLAAGGLTLTKLYTGGSRTALALPLMMRGSYDATPVAAVLHDAGVTSTVVFAYRHGSLEGNVLDGFEVVKRPPEGDKRFRATEVTDLALADLADPAHAKKHLLWAHYFDAHGPRAARMLPPDLPRHGPIPGSVSDSALYLDEIAYDDHELARLLEGLSRTGDMNKTLLIVSADHGEGFGTHNVFEHGQSGFEEIIHVPGVVVGSGLGPGRYDHVVSHRDVAATVLGAFGLAGRTAHAEELGRSWLRLRSGAEAPLHTFVTTYSSSAHVFTWAEAPLMVRVDDDKKLTVAYRDGIQRLFHLRSPEGEDRDVSADYRDETARARRELELYRDIDRPPP